MAPPSAEAAPLTSRAGSLGDLATAAFVVAALTGAAVAVPYDTADGFGSIAAMLLANPAASLLRNLHYWSSQACLVLTLLHMWDHLRARTELRVRRGMWFRLTLALPLLVFVLLSGFMLRGDADARQALRIVTEAISQIPLLGSGSATFLFGPGTRLEVIYIQHAATATILVWLLIIEHARRVWPKPASFFTIVLLSLFLSLWLTPGLHDGLDPVIKGPWYFLGLQEILHWASRPLAVVPGGAACLLLLFGLRLIRPSRADILKLGLLGTFGLYLGLCAIGGFFRGTNWSWAPGWPGRAGNLRAGWIFDAVPAAPVPLPLAMGRPEGCLICHPGVTGLGKAHKPEAIGCASCHGGDTLTLNKIAAHTGMDAIPGNLSTAALRCGASACHPALVARVERSIMSTMRGVVEVDRRVLGENDATTASPAAHVADLGHTPADTHLRQLCAACHLGNPKTELGPAPEDAYGGGCNACHLVYDPATKEALRAYVAQKATGNATPPRIHPALSLDIGNQQCFGCHSRSGRISTNYEGWHEMHEPSEALRLAGTSPASGYRTLADDRVFERKTPDIHQQRGMDCIDCHTPLEVMGDGTAHARKHAQLRLDCADCHPPSGTPFRSLPASQLDPESRRILSLRARPGGTPTQFIATAKGDALLNGILAEPGSRAKLLRKRGSQALELKHAGPACAGDRGHERLSCGACHTAWAPRCTSCHTTYDPKVEAYDWIARRDVQGAWKEHAEAFDAGLPTLGIRVIQAHKGGGKERVETFTPGMIQTIEFPQDSGKAKPPLFRRLYARAEPHTTRKKARSCASCHTDPVALGYGQGQLSYELAPGGGRWRFKPSAPILADGLPADAWIPFLGGRTDMTSTRDDVRPFNLDEQRRILRVGACLTCHDEGSRVIRNSVGRFDHLMARRTAKCLLPIWD